MINRILQWFACKLGHHKWTCAAAEGIPATKQQIEGGIVGFYSYARMYCKTCGKESQISERARIHSYAQSDSSNGGKGSGEEHASEGKP